MAGRGLRGGGEVLVEGELGSTAEGAVPPVEGSSGVAAGASGEGDEVDDGVLGVDGLLGMDETVGAWAEMASMSSPVSSYQRQWKFLVLNSRIVSGRYKEGRGKSGVRKNGANEETSVFCWVADGSRTLAKDRLSKSQLTAHQQNRAKGSGQTNGSLSGCIHRESGFCSQHESARAPTTSVNTQNVGKILIEI
jgi:hypothetical protein